MKAINIILTIYVIITNIIIALLVFFIELENEIFIAFFIALGALLLLLIRYCIKVKNERK